MQMTAGGDCLAQKKLFGVITIALAQHMKQHWHDNNFVVKMTAVSSTAAVTHWCVKWHVTMTAATPTN